MRIAAAWSWRLLLVGALGGVVFLVIELRLVVIPLLVAMLLAALLVPFVQFLQRHRWPKWLAVTVADTRALWSSSADSCPGRLTVSAPGPATSRQSLVAWEEFRELLLQGPSTSPSA